MRRNQILNSQGAPVELTDAEQFRAEILEEQISREFQNSLGYDIDVTSLTQILARVIEQKFYEVAPADYMPVVVGEGAWADFLTTYRDFQIGGDFEQGLINTGTENARIAEVSSGVDAVNIKVNNWAKLVNWTLVDLNMATRSGNWNVVESKEKSRKRNWDLGIQKVAFLGATSNSEIKGLLTQSAVNANTTVITEYISGMTDAEFQTLVKNIIEAYRANAVRTAYPDRFIIPEADYNGLGTAVSTTFPMITKLEYLEKTFKTLTMNPNFKILPLAYADQANNADIVGLNKNRYTLMRYDQDSLRMDIPVNYTSTLQNTLNGFQFQSVAYGQFTGVQAYRPLEMLYFDWNA